MIAGNYFFYETLIQSIGPTPAGVLTTALAIAARNGTSDLLIQKQASEPLLLGHRTQQCIEQTVYEALS